VAKRKRAWNRAFLFEASLFSSQTEAGRATASAFITCCVKNDKLKPEDWNFVVSSKYILSGSQPPAFGSGPQLKIGGSVNIVCEVHCCQKTSSCFQNVSFSGAKKNSRVLSLHDTASGLKFGVSQQTVEAVPPEGTPWASAKLKLRGFQIVPLGIVSTRERSILFHLEGLMARWPPKCHVRVSQRLSLSLSLSPSLLSVPLQPARPPLPLQHGAVQAVRPEEWRRLSQLPSQHGRTPLPLLQGGLLQGHDQVHLSPQGLQR